MEEERPSPAVRNIKSYVLDRWYSRQPLVDESGRTVLDNRGKPVHAPTSRHNKGLRWQARFVPERGGKEISKSFPKKVDAEAWLREQMADVEDSAPWGGVVRIGEPTGS